MLSKKSISTTSDTFVTVDAPVVHGIPCSLVLLHSLR